jgi:hypothetical protein
METVKWLLKVLICIDLSNYSELSVFYCSVLVAERTALRRLISLICAGWLPHDNRFVTGAASLYVRGSSRCRAPPTAGSVNTVEFALSKQYLEPLVACARHGVV